MRSSQMFLKGFNGNFPVRVEWEQGGGDPANLSSRAQPPDYVVDFRQ